MTDLEFKFLRKRVMASSGGDRVVLLRRYLRAKAERGIWDDRYCAYWNVSANVTPKLRAAIMRGFAKGLVPTSTLRFPVGGGSWHQARDVKGRGRAVDMGLRRGLIATLLGRRRMVRFQLAELERHRASRPHWQELLGPDNSAAVLKGAETDLREGTFLEEQHDTHVHIADAS